MKIKLLKAEDLLIILFVVSAVVGVSISYHKIYLFHVLGILIFGIFLLKIIKDGRIKYTRLPTKYHYMFYFIFIWYLLSIFWSWCRSYSIIYMFYIINGVFLALVIIYYIGCDRRRQLKVFSALKFIFVILIVISLLEIFTNFKLPHSPYPAEMHVASGFFGNMNHLASAMVMILPFFLFISEKLILKYLGLMVIFMIIIFADSRGNILASVFIIFIYFVAYKKNINLINLCKNIIYLFLIILVLFYFNDKYFLGLEKIESSYTALQRYIDLNEIEGYDSVGVRKQLIINGLEALYSSYGLGVGGGASKYVQERLSNTNGILSMHNFWMEILVEGGIVFFVIFIIWYISLFGHLYLIVNRSSDKKEKYFASALSLSLIGLIPAAVSPSSVIYFLPMWILFGFAITVVNINKKYMQ